MFHTKQNIASTEQEKGKDIQIEGSDEEEKDEGRVPSDKEDESQKEQEEECDHESPNGQTKVPD